jgi:hypothetical protein
MSMNNNNESNGKDGMNRMRSKSINRSKSGVGAIIAGVFLIGIIGTTLLVYFLSIAQAQQERSRAELEAQNLRNEALMENYKVLTDIELVSNKIKYTIVNNGVLPVSVKSIIVSDVVNGNKPVETRIFDDSNTLVINGGNVYQSLTNPIDTSILTNCPIDGDDKCYRIDVISERGNVQSATYPPEMVAFAKKAGEAEKSKDSQSAAEAALAQQTGSILLNFNSFGAIICIINDNCNESSNSRGGVDQRGWDVRIDDGVGYPAFRLIHDKVTYFTVTVKNKDTSGNDIRLLHTSTMVITRDNGTSFSQNAFYLCNADINKTITYPLTLKVTQGSLTIGSNAYGVGSVFKASAGTELTASSNATLNNTAKTVTYPAAGGTITVSQGSLFIDSTTYNANANPNPIFTAAPNTILVISSNATLNNTSKTVAYPAADTLTLTVTQGSLKIGSNTYGVGSEFKASANAILEVTSDATLNNTAKTVTYPSGGGTLTVLSGTLTIGNEVYKARDVLLASPNTVLTASNNATLDNTAKTVSQYDNNNPIILPNVKDSTNPDEGWVTLVFCDTDFGTSFQATGPQNKVNTSKINMFFLILRGEMSDGTPYAQTIPYQSVLIPNGSFTITLRNASNTADKYTGSPGDTVRVNSDTNGTYSIYWIYPDGKSRLLGTITSGTSTNITVPSDAERGRFYAIQVQDSNEIVYYATFKVI